MAFHDKTRDEALPGVTPLTQKKPIMVKVKEINSDQKTFLAEDGKNYLTQDLQGVLFNAGDSVLVENGRVVPKFLEDRQAAKD